MCPDNSMSAGGSTVLTDCKCNAGYVWENTTSTPVNGTCTSCEAGKYKDELGTATCTACPVNSTSEVGSTSLSNCTCVGGYYGSMGNCTMCPDNSMSAGGSTVLTDCKCNAGYVWENTTSTCSACSRGTYRGENDTECLACEAGKYSSTEGSPECQMCPEHASSLAGSMELTDCICDAGYTGLNGSNCTACPAGQYKASNGSSQCAPCSAGTYNNATGATVCSGSCAETFTSPEGSSSEEACGCVPGLSPVNGTCTSCEAGKYKDELGTATCTACPVNSTSEVGSTSLSNCTCVGGYYGSMGNCTMCPDNSMSAGGSTVLTDCKCNAGYVSSSTDCRCDYGSYGDGCLPCPVGKYKDNIGSEACQQCPPNSTSSTGARHIEECACNAGFFGVNGGVCVQCESGKYKSVGLLCGGSDCAPCPDGFNLTVSSSTGSVSNVTIESSSSGRLVISHTADMLVGALYRYSWCFLNPPQGQESPNIFIEASASSQAGISFHPALMLKAPGRSAPLAIDGLSLLHATQSDPSQVRERA
ncbi:hypothetical protein GUITHDRAFT_64694 [Guillardia theta CCMP2712]|uniref:Tyrosine-protein kinase ephrin type A/B receptor-like domain-containing protein n=1 Tax=Guillardia theta (strain CCMP2712) TaxID=905079 RepID=L1JXS4_GUITC|nr:hypothetical protein GUITHDRAFT_64694 [Guillardia theta CCMP2712]EKX52888.1 hypothetical protein GUITHDRAFT_64694 [Guillardia theta CCMP2712]|eukprot:XP_005839868.1 hypothetical protein GUITHDRAFT_64694 [Guillardia theta CCMP2712]